MNFIGGDTTEPETIPPAPGSESSEVAAESSSSSSESEANDSSESSLGEVYVADDIAAPEGDDDNGGAPEHSLKISREGSLAIER